MKIQPGMLCMVIGGRNAGRECTVIRWVKKEQWIDEVRGWATVSSWLVQGPNIELRSSVDGYIFMGGFSSESHLMPLANGGEDAIVKSEVNDYVARQTNKDTLLPERA